MSAKSITPLFAVGDVVSYEDREGRRQTGSVQAIEAKWYGADPYLICTLHHPTYAGRRYYANPECIIGIEP